MTAQEYILAQLEALKKPVFLNAKTTNTREMVDAIYTTLMSKKFRKFSVPQKNQAIIRAAIEKNIVHDEPIKISFPFGGYKLWRFEETPEVDWAELFSLMYYIRWLKPVCALYPKGATFTLWFDEVVISQMNNIPQTDLVAYRTSLEKIVSFLKPYMPDNLKIEFFLERSRYESNEVFQTELAREIEKLKATRAKNPQPLTDKAIRSIEMNVKLTPKQAEDPLWREKVDLLHYAYYNLQESHDRIRRPYVSENITAFPVFFEPNVVPIGSTKTSIVRFWVGVGVLEKRDQSYIENILSISQLEKAKATWKSVTIPQLEGKNFNKIRVIESPVNI